MEKNKLKKNWNDITIQYDHIKDVGALSVLVENY